MNNKQKFLFRISLLLIINISVIYFFYVQPGFATNLWIWIYNSFSIAVILAAIASYGYALLHSYKIRELNAEHKFPDTYKRWKAVWDEYRSTFIPDISKTTVPAEVYFNSENLILNSHERIPVMALIKAMPGTYTGLGILGTFMGFAAGLQGFNSATSETMQKSITTLLSGINTAFNTSIAGVLLSITFNFIFLQPLLKRLEHDCSRLAERIDQTFYIDGLEHVKDLIILDDGVTRLTPREISRIIVEELKQQTASLANFSTDLSDQIKNLAETMVLTYREEMGKMISGQILPVLDTLSKSTSQLVEEKKESATEAVSSIVQRLESSLSDFMRTFKDEVTEQTKREMAELASQLKNAGDSISSVPGMLADLQSKFEKMTQVSIEAINNATLNGATLQNETIETLRALTNEFVAQIEQFRQSLSSIQSQNAYAEKIAEKLAEVSEASEDAVRRLVENFSEFRKQNETMLQHIREESESLRKTAETVKASAEGFKGLDESLANTFSMIKGNIKEYSQVTQESLSHYLAEYTDSIRGFAERLAGAVEQLPELIEELKETIEHESARR